MPELRRFIWDWETILQRIERGDPRLHRRIEPYARPIAAERLPDGNLLLVLGCWSADERRIIATDAERKSLETILKRFYKEGVGVAVVPWPAGDGPAGTPPDPLEGLDDRIRVLGNRTDSVLVRTLFAALARRGLVLECNYPVLNYRLDLASPQQRVGVEVGGWSWKRRTPAGALLAREREQNLDFEGWRVLWFSGEEVASRTDWAADAVRTALRGNSRR